MKIHYTVALAMLAGAAVGAVAISGLQAQGKAPGAYAVVEFNEISDPAAFKDIIDKAPAVIAASGGRFIIRTNNFTALRGDMPTRLVVIAFDNVQQAQAWYGSEGMKGINATVEKITKGRTFAVEAVAN
jgi:uncharacterized protein (DUF1330 family)